MIATKTICSSCNFENKTEAVYCASCGAKIEQQQHQHQQNSWQSPQTFNILANAIKCSID